MNKPKHYTVSKCCHDKIKEAVPQGRRARMERYDPIPYCTACDLFNPEEVEVDEHGKVIDDDDA